MKYVDAHCSDPFKYEVGDYVWVCKKIKPNKAKGIIGKLRFQHTGLWEIVTYRQCVSYRLRHCRKQNTKDKKKAYVLLPYPDKLIAIPPLAGCDTSYVEMNKSILKNQYCESVINNSTNPIPVSTPATNLLVVVIPFKKYNVSPFPTLSESNEELEGCFDSISTKDDNLQSGSKVLANPSLFASHSKN